jgi:hypothetical protein
VTWPGQQGQLAGDLVDISGDRRGEAAADHDRLGADQLGRADEGGRKGRAALFDRRDGPRRTAGEAGPQLVERDLGAGRGCGGRAFTLVIHPVS